MLELMLVGGSYVFGGLVIIGLVWALGALVTWPFDLKAELHRQNNRLKDAHETNDQLRKFINQEGLNNKYNNWR